ncbi:hypothetical protein STENM223S_09191 [Streptomyces tendae]
MRRARGLYLVLLACFIALGGVFEGSGRARTLARVTFGGTVLQLALATWLSGWGLPGGGYGAVDGGAVRGGVPDAPAHGTARRGGR